MKNLKLLLVGLMLVLTVSCGEKGVSRQKLTGFESNLPDELRGLKVYSVNDGALSYIKVAVLNGQINSVTYPVGKTQETTIMVNKNGQDRVIHAREILSENDSIIVIRK